MVLTAGGMLRTGTPVEDHTKDFGLYVKREDLSCPPPGPPFSKTRGVYAWVEKRPEKMIGVLDTYHSQGGHAVARACQVLGKKCVVYYPEYKHDPGWRPPQDRAKALGADLVGLPAGRSCILYHAAKKRTEAAGGVMIPNALKLDESVAETAKEVGSRPFRTVLVPASSGTIAAGVIRGFCDMFEESPRFLIHLGYSRPETEVRRYLSEASGVDVSGLDLTVIDEDYQYKDQAKAGPTPPWPCNQYYDLKAFRWYLDNRDRFSGDSLLWNIG